MKLHLLAAVVIAFSPLDDETAKPTTTDDDAPRFHCEWCRDTAGSGVIFLPRASREAAAGFDFAVAEREWDERSGD